MSTNRSSMPVEDNPSATPASAALAGSGRPSLARAPLDVWRWVNSPSHRWWFWPLIIGLLTVIFLHPLDAYFVARLPDGAKLPGDVRREWTALQQFGAVSSLFIIAIIIFVQDPLRRARLFDVLAGVGAAALASWLLKMLLGRPRPRYGDPDMFLGPFGSYPVLHGDAFTLQHAWEFWKKDAASLWSMPSSHTTAAVALAAGLATLYPRLRWLFFALAAIVAAGRMVFDAHYFTDVLAGVTVGLLAAAAMVRLQWGSRLYDHLTGRGPSAPPRQIA